METVPWSATEAPPRFGAYSPTQPVTARSKSPFGADSVLRPGGRGAVARTLEQALAEAERRQLASHSRLSALACPLSAPPGARALRILIDTGKPRALTRSEAEERLLFLLRKAKLPAPDVNVRLEGFEVDFLWRDAGLVVEVDGYAFHSDRAAFEDDRRRCPAARSVQSSQSRRVAAPALRGG